MPRLAVKFAKQGPARFLSHLEVMRTFARALRRAGLPLRFSLGYNPHPHLSFAAPLGVGVSSETEWMEVEVTRPGLVSTFWENVPQELPAGLEILEVIERPEDRSALMSRVQLAGYRIHLTLEPRPTAAELEEKARQFLHQETIPVVRETPKGRREKDIRPGIYWFRATGSAAAVVLETFLAAGSRRHVRPDELVAAFLSFGEWQAIRPPGICRTGLYTVDYAGRVEELGDFCRGK